MEGVVFCSKDIYSKLNSHVVKNSFRMYLESDYEVRFVLDHYLPTNTIVSLDPLIIEVLKEIELDLKEFL